MSQLSTIIKHFKKITPRNLMEDMHGSVFISEKDLEIIERYRLNLPDEVVNPIVHYILSKNDMKLSAGYLQNIMSRFDRLRISTAEEAMEKLKDIHEEMNYKGIEEIAEIKNKVRILEKEIERLKKEI